MRVVQIMVFARLKEFFESDFKLELSAHEQTVDRVLAKLQTMNPAAAEVLRGCRVAINENLVDGTADVPENSVLAILPPSSGG